jgi:hypothetical protein
MMMEIAAGELHGRIDDAEKVVRNTCRRARRSAAKLKLNRTEISFENK